MAALRPNRLPLLRQNLLALKNYLRILHMLVKPAADAHTLTIPAPLIDLASQQLQQVQGMKHSKIVILLTPEFMYFQRPHTIVKEQAQIVRNLIPRAVFPKKLGFIELPYSQGPSFFTNLVIYHEIGHFVYEELANEATPHPDMIQLKIVSHRTLAKLFKERQVFALAAKIIQDWIQEIFCDLFAIRLVGPAFSFALVETLGMLGLLSDANIRLFKFSHPAPACRFAEHLHMLKNDLWWQELRDMKASQKNLIEDFATVNRREYGFYAHETRVGSRGKRLIDGFLDSIVPAIRTLVQNITQDPAGPVKRFADTRQEIEDCFFAGIVPKTARSSPDPISIINTSFCFYLTSLQAVIKKFEGTKAENAVGVHSLWTKRLEMWTMKAIEDSQMQSAFDRVRQTNLWSSQGQK
ncbi:MAG: hypothetical protein ACJ71Q_17885 [Terriglobales bacterium]